MSSATEIVYVADSDRSSFEEARPLIDVVCSGDSLTGWNNFGPASTWPYRTYPDFLQELVRPLGLRVANGGIAGEISDNGPQQVRDYLRLFPNARYFVIGFGTNDLGTWPNLEATSHRIIQNMDEMVRSVQSHGKQPTLFNVPYANKSMFSSRIARELHEKRDYHNERLKEFCDRRQLPLADICSKLHDEHFGDELHPNDRGAKIIAAEVHLTFLAIHETTQSMGGSMWISCISELPY